MKLSKDSRKCKIAFTAILTYEITKKKTCLTI